MSWDYFIYFALPTLCCFILGAITAYFPNQRKLTTLFNIAGILILSFFVMGLWIGLQRPPLRTMGETRLWYAFFLPICGFFVFKKYKFAFILSFTTILSAVFLLLNLLKPEIHDQTLMPALQSPWFAPHVLVYMFAYALLGVPFLLAIYRLFPRAKWTRANTFFSAQTLHTEDILTRIAWIFLLIGMLFGSLWAKEAWGHFWTWDPKETWAAAAFLCYTLYLHLRVAFPQREREAQWVQIVGFILLQMCWYGLQLFPSLANGSMHLYS